MATRRIFLAGAAAATFGTVSCRSVRRDSISVGVDKDFSVLDPAFRTGTQDSNVIRAVFQRLSTIAADSGELLLDAASELKQVSDTVFEFTLKRDQVFTDGFGEMSAEDVKFSFERFGVSLSGGVASPYNDWRDLKRVDVTGKYSGRIVLERARAELMRIAIADVGGSIVCRKAIERLGAAHDTRPVGSGPFKVASFEKQKGIVLTRNAAYVGRPSGYEQIDLRVVEDPKTTEFSLRTGELDFSLLPTLPQALSASASGLKIDVRPSIANIWIGINTQKKPFDDVRVRKAFRLALDVDQMLVAAYDGRAQRSNALVMPEVLGFWRDAPVLKRNTALAKQLLAEAGVVPGFTCQMLVRDQPVFRTMALVARACLAEVGINLQVRALEGGSYLASGKGDQGKSLDTFILDFKGKMDPNSLAQWFTTGQIGIWNWQRWSDRRFDALLDQASAELHPAVRSALIVQAQRLMEESEAFVWLTHGTTTAVYRTWLKPALFPGGSDWALDRFAPA